MRESNARSEFLDTSRGNWRRDFFHRLNGRRTYKPEGNEGATPRSANLISGSGTRRAVSAVVCGYNDAADGYSNDDRDDDVPLLMTGS